MRKIGNRIMATLALVALLLGLLPAASASATVSYVKWGWVTVRNTSLGTYTPAAVDRGNSAGRANIVKQTEAGKYTVRFKGIGDDGGVPHVTAMGSAQRICLLTGWGRGSVAANQEVYVSCYTLGGARVSTRFSVTYVATNDGPGPFAYLYAFGTATEDASLQYSHNSSGGTNHIERTDVGRYQVTLPGLGGASGHVEISVHNGGAVTAGVGTAGTNPATCNVEGWGGSSGGGVAIFVRCYESHGTFADSPFTLTYTDQQGLKGHATGKVAYLWADKPLLQAYTPHPVYSYSKPAATPRINSDLVGRYKVKLPRMPFGGAAVLTAYGPDPRTCQLENIRTSGSFQQVKVRCFGFDGSFADNQFTLSYLR
jgi:hypothetical protein